MAQVNLERKFDIVEEKALFRCQQKMDENSDSYLARTEVVRTELHMKKNLKEVQAYITLQGSRLTPEDKKRVLVESGAERSGAELEVEKVNAAIRTLGSTFFQEFTTGKKDKNMKTYDHLTFGVDHVDEPQEENLMDCEEEWDEETLEAMAVGDEDASLVWQCENAMMDTIQEDKDLATFYVSYQDARRRLLEKTRSRGFWPLKVEIQWQKGFCNFNFGAGKSGRRPGSPWRARRAFGGNRRL